MTNQKGSAHLFLLVAALGVITFLLVSAMAPFKDKLFSLLYPKPSSRAATTTEVSFKTYKGLDFPWGLSSGGFSTYTDWLSTKYEEAAMITSFDAIKNMGALTVCKFLFLDRMLVKDSNWGTDAYITQWNPTYKANWEGLLKNVVKPRGMELVVTLLNPASDIDRDPTNFERSTFVPDISGSDLLGPAINNGNMETGTGSMPDGWTIYRGDPANIISWEPSGGQSSGLDRNLKLTSLTSKFMGLTSPAVTVTRGTLLSLSIYLKGEARSFWTDYLDASGNVLDRDMYVNRLSPTTSWTKLTWASREGNDMPQGTVKVRLSVNVDAGKSASFDSAQIAPGARNAKWRNYITAIKDWVTMYGSNSEYGPALAAWIGIKEVYDSVPPYTAHAFSRDLYQIIKSTGTSQTVGIDSSPLAKLPVTDPTNLGWYNDAADFYSIHIYKNDGVLPDTSKLDKPFILGEFGADWKCPNGGIPPTDCAWVDVPMTDPVLDLTATSNFYQNALAAGAKTALGWEWVNRPVATHTGGVHTLGPVGNWIKNWIVPDASATPVPTQTPIPTPIPTPTHTPAPLSTPTSSPADAMPPTVSITNPLNNAKIQHGSTVLISALATDNTGVTKVEFYVSDSLKCISTSAPYRCSWKVPGKRGTKYTLKATAYDRSANRSSSSITVLAQ